MKLKQLITIFSIRSIAILCGFILVIFNCFKVDAQAKITKDLAFGTFATNGLGGTITISTGGIISSTGGVTYSSGSYYPAHLQVVFNNSGANNHIDISYPSNQYLSGSNGGKIYVTLSPNAGRYSNIINKIIDLDIGGSLKIGASSVNPPGNYNGYIYINCTINSP